MRDPSRDGKNGGSGRKRLSTAAGRKSRRTFALAAITQPPTLVHTTLVISRIFSSYLQHDASTFQPFRVYSMRDCSAKSLIALFLDDGLISISHPWCFRSGQKLSASCRHHYSTRPYPLWRIFLRVRKHTTRSSTYGSPSPRRTSRRYPLVRERKKGRGGGGGFGEFNSSSSSSSS